MKVSREEPFRPIVLVLEHQSEVDAMIAALFGAGKQATQHMWEQIVKETGEG